MGKKLAGIGVVILLLAAAGISGFAAADERAGIRPTPPLSTDWR